MYDLRRLIHDFETIIANHSLGKPGAYRRWNWQPASATQSGKPDPARLSADQRDLGINPYGCADAANILYTIGCFPSDPVERQGWIETLQSLQNPQSGLFVESTHHPIHTTAHCIAALELFDARPLHPLNELSDLRHPDKMTAFLDNLNWKGSPWTESHKGAGLYAALVLAGEVDLEWQERYFAWLWDQADPQTGFWRKGMVEPVPTGEVSTIFPHLAGSFHYLFNHEYARKPLRYPAAVIDTCLDLFYQGEYPLGNRIGFAEIDWVFCITRALRQSGHRFGDARRALLEFSDRFIPYLLSLDTASDDGLNDLHSLFGTACALAELQTALPGLLLTERPLKLVLDRRPFI